MAKKNIAPKGDWKPIKCLLTIEDEKFNIAIVSKVINVPGIGILTADEVAQRPDALSVLLKNESFSIKQI
jgi:hypothetical protein